MNPDDTEVSRALQQLATASHPPVNQIRSRARILRRRRHGAAATLSVLAAAAIATPVVGAVGDQGTEPRYADSSTTTNESQEPADPGNCGSQGDPDHRTAESLTQEEVPDQVRLLWSESVAEPPASARAEDPYHHFDKYYPASCHEIPEPTLWSVRIYNVAPDDVITRAIGINAGPAGKVDPPEGSFVLEVGSVDVSVFRPDDFDDPPYYADVPSPILEAYWTSADGVPWRLLSHRNVTDAEIRDLVESATVENDRIEVGDSSVARNASLITREGDEESAYQPGYASYEATGPSLHLRVDELDGDGDSANTFWAEAGHLYLADGVNGNPAVVLMSDPEEPTVRWEPVPGQVAASLTGSGYNVDELLDIARSIEPVPADDERLNDVWGTCPADEHSSSLISPCDE